MEISLDLLEEEDQGHGIAKSPGVIKALFLMLGVYRPPLGTDFEEDTHSTRDQPSVDNNVNEKDQHTVSEKEILLVRVPERGKSGERYYGTLGYRGPRSDDVPVQVFPRLLSRPSLLTGLSVLWQTTLLGFLFWDGADTTGHTWGSKGQELFFISKVTFLARLAIPIFVTNSALILQVFSCRNFKWWLIFHHRFINRRMRFLDFHETRIYEISAVVCFVVSLGAGLVDVCVFTVLLGPNNWARVCKLTVWCLAFLHFGALWYALNLYKCSLEAELQEVCAFLHNNIKDVDACRERIRRARVDYKAVRSFSSTYFVLHVSICVFSVAAHVYWTSVISSTWEKVDLGAIGTVAMIWSETVFFLVVPVTCLGGVNIDHTWHLFQIHSCPAQRHGNENEWNQIGRYVREACPHKTGPWRLVILFTVVALFGTLHLANQNPHFYPWPTAIPAVVSSPAGNLTRD